MNLFYGRPLAFSLCIAVGMSVLTLFLSGSGKLAFLFIALLLIFFLLLSVLLQKRCGRIRSLSLLCLCFTVLLVFSSWLFFDRSVEDFRKRTENGCTAEGYVIERWGSSAWESSLVVRLETVNGERCDKKVLLKCSYPSSLQLGERFRLHGKWETVRDDALYRESQSLTSHGCVGILRCASSADCSVLTETKRSPFLWLRQKNLELSQRLRHAVGGEAGGLAAALLLGNRNALSADTELAFRRAGVSHLLALSGMHVSVLIALMERFLYFLRLPKRLRAVFILLGSLSYLALTGFAVSTVRAVLMVCLMYLGFFLQENYDSFTTLCVILFLILLFTPYAVTDIALWLSFSATAAIVIFVPTLTEYYKKAKWKKVLPRPIATIIRWLGTATVVGLFANAGVLPFTAMAFGSVSLFSVPITCLLSPLLFPVLILSLLSLLFYRAEWIGFLTRWCIDWLLQFADRVSDIKNATVRLDGKSVLIFVFCLAVSLLTMAIVNLKRKGWLILPVLLSGAVLVSGYLDVLPRSLGTSVSFFSENGNDTIIMTEGRSTVAIDLSNGSSTSKSAVLQAAPFDRFTELDALVLTHYHSKSTALIASLAGSIKIHTLHLPTPQTEAEREIAARLEQEAVAHGIKVRSGEKTWGGIGAEVLLEHRIFGEGEESSVILTLRVRDHVLTYLGAGSITEESLSVAQNAILSAQTLVLGTHGVGSPPCELPLMFSQRTTKVWLSDSPYWSCVRARDSFLQLPVQTSRDGCRFFVK